MLSHPKNNVKGDRHTWFDEDQTRLLLLHDLETAATVAFRHPKIDPISVYHSNDHLGNVQLGTKQQAHTVDWKEW